MSSILIASAPAHFLTGLALFTLAAMISATLGRAAVRPPAAWGLSAVIALALAEWCELAAGGSTLPVVWQLIRLTFEIVALAGLIELGRLSTAGRRAVLLPRWSYPIVAALALAAVLLARLNPLEFALRLAILWQTGWLAAGYLTRGQTSVGDSAGETTMARIAPGTIAARAILAGLLVYLLAACVAIPLLGTAAALVAAVAAYVGFGPSPEQSPRAKLLWRSAWPVGFVLIATGGCFALSAGVTETDVLLVELVEPADGAAADDLASADSSDPEANDGGPDEMAADREAAADSDKFVRQAKRYGLGIAAPIVLFVLLVWGLSRLPFVH